MSKNDRKHEAERPKGRFVTDEELEALIAAGVAKRVADITLMAANRARGEGREELARTWEYLSNVALSNMPRN